jgi:hypothetical protein
MRMKILSSLPALALFLAASHGGSATAQTYTLSDLEPTNNTTILKNSTVGCQGNITISNGAPPPTNVKVTITDANGKKYVGTGGVSSAGRNNWHFTVTVRIPATAATGKAQCLFQVSTNRGTTYNAASAQTTPKIT